MYSDASGTTKFLTKTMFQQSDVETYLDRVVWGSLSSSFPLTDYGKSGTTILSVDRVNERTVSTEVITLFSLSSVKPLWAADC
jgi:hypothetical protein